jgi:methyl-accepting chemotaxis protein
MTPTVGVKPTAMFPAEKTTKVVAAPTFKSAKDIRRFLGDAASGVTAEGYEAIGQNLARDLYGQLSDAMKSFSPEFGSYLQRYKDLSSQIDAAGTKLGKALIGVEKDAPAYYAVDASKIADRAFSSPENISTLIDAMGGNKQPVMAMAERYFANEIAGKTTEQARKFLTSDKVRSLLDELGPEFRSRIETRYFTKASEQSKISEMAQSVAVESEQSIKDLTNKISDLSKNVQTTKENIANLKSQIDTGLERIRVSVSDADRTKNATDLLSSLKNVLPPETYAEAENMVTQMKEASKRQSQARKILGGAATAIGLGYVAKTPLTNILSGQ